MGEFIKGFLLGVLLKKRVVKILDFVLEKSLLVIDKIKNNNQNNQNNQKNNQVINSKLLIKVVHKDILLPIPPLWDYYPNKNVIIIDIPGLNVNLINKDYTFTELINLRINGEYLVTLDIPLIKSLGDMYLFVPYYFNDREYINVYSEYSLISNVDFTAPLELDNEILSVSLKFNDNKTEYIKEYYHKFLRNDSLTLELLLLFYPKDIVNITETKLYTINPKRIEEYSYNDKII